MKDRETRTTRQDLDNVCCDCADFVKETTDCKKCGVSKLKTEINKEPRE